MSRKNKILNNIYYYICFIYIIILYFCIVYKDSCNSYVISPYYVLLAIGKNNKRVIFEIVILKMYKTKN